MTRYAEIVDGVVTNIIKADEDFASERGLVLADSEDAIIGATYSNGTFTRPPKPEPEVVVPSVVTSFQGKMALKQSGEFDAVQAFVDQSDELTQFAWENAPNFMRSSPMINSLGEALWGDEKDAKLDQLFLAAKDILV